MGRSEAELTFSPFNIKVEFAIYITQTNRFFWEDGQISS